MAQEKQNNTPQYEGDVGTGRKGLLTIKRTRQVTWRRDGWTEKSSKNETEKETSHAQYVLKFRWNRDWKTKLLS